LVRRVAWTLCLLSVVGVSAADGQPVNGRSRELGLEFATVGGAKWCGPSVTVQLTGSDPAVLTLDHPLFLVTLGRIRAIVVGQCPAVEVLTFDGRSRNGRVFAAEVLRLTGWRRYVALDPVTQRPSCEGAAPDPSECNKRIAAYGTVKQLLRGPPFADTELTTMLDTAAEEHVVWRTGSVLGKLQLTNPRELASQFASNAELADAIIAQSEEACRTDGGAPGEIATGDYVGDLAYRSVGCQPVNGQAHQSSVLVASRDGWFYVFNLWAEAPHAEALDGFAIVLLRAVSALSAK
jgi:hypothetical protein